MSATAQGSSGAPWTRVIPPLCSGDLGAIWGLQQGSALVSRHLVPVRKLLDQSLLGLEFVFLMLAGLLVAS